MKKLIWVTTVSQSMRLFRRQLKYMSQYFDLTFVASNECDVNEMAELGRVEGVKVHEISMVREISLLKDIKSLFTFCFYFIKQKPDAVHGNTPKGGLLSMLAARLTGVKTRIYMCHGLRYQGCFGFKRNLLKLMERITCMCASHIICVSEGVRDTLDEDGICNKNKTIVIANGSCNGIDINIFDPEIYSVDECDTLRSKYGVKHDDFLFIFIGRIVKDKGINEMIEAFVRYHNENSNVRLMVLGEFENKHNSVEHAVKEIIKDNRKGVVYCGKQLDVKPFLAISQCLLLPSYREGFGMVLMEAGCMGVPVIASDIIGCNNVVNVSENGLLVEPKNVEKLYETMKTIVENKQLYQMYKNTTRSSIKRRFEQKDLWRKFLEFYQEII